MRCNRDPDLGNVDPTVRRPDRWEAHFLTLAQAAAQMSKDPSTQVGAVIVRPDRTVASMGYNGFPRGCNDHSTLYGDRDAKLSRVVHAEMNAIIHAREPLRGYSMYCWPFTSCDRCMACIIQTGIRTVYSPPTPADLKTRWHDSIASAEQMAFEAGVSVIHLFGEVK